MWSGPCFSSFVLLLRLLDSRHPSGREVVSSWHLICIPLMANECAHLVGCLLPIYVSSLQNRLFRSESSFQISLCRSLTETVRDHRSCTRSGPAHAFSPHPLCSGHNVREAASWFPLQSFAWAVSSANQRSHGLSGVCLSRAFPVSSVSRAATPSFFLAHLKVPFDLYLFIYFFTIC